MNEIQKTTRLNWVDWMKALGMYTIIVGHTFPIGLCAFIYSFSVPLFFFISVFLDKRPSNWKNCIIKNIQTLFIPYILISITNTIIIYLQDGTSWSIWLWLQKFLYIGLGLHNLFGVRGCGSMWFVYTLIVIKLLFFACNENKRNMITLSSIGIIGALLFNHIIGKGFSWAVTNAMLSFTFYVLGYMSTPLLKKEKHLNKRVTILGFFTLTYILYVLSNINNVAYMYLGWYGNYILLFYLCALIGIAMMYMMSLWLSQIKSKWVLTIASGNIIILGFHEQLLILLEYFTPTNNIYGEGTITAIKLIFSFIILILFIPVIRLVKCYCPILMGHR